MKHALVLVTGLLVLGCTDPASTVDCTILSEDKNAEEIVLSLQEIHMETEEGRVQRFKALSDRYEMLEAKCVEVHAAYSYSEETE
jgi:hypothetical protein